jgi:hypothetical protein
MKEDGDIATYFLIVDGFVNTIRILGEEIQESTVFQKVLRSLPLKFDPKISMIEEYINLKTLIMHVLHVSLTTYEMRTEQEKPSKHEETFKA